VDVTTVSRAHDIFRTREANSASALAAMDASRMAQLRQLEGVFRTGEAGLGYAATQFLNSFAELAARPTDSANRQVVLGNAMSLGARFTEAGQALDQLQTNLRVEMQAGVNDVNALARSVVAINQQLAGMPPGQPPNDLLDERDRLVAQLGGLIKVTRIDNADGTVALFVGGGQALVMGQRAGTLAVGQDSADPSRLALTLNEGGLQRQLGSSLLGGSLAGLLRFQNQDLVDARNLVGRLAATIGTAVNDQQSRGLSLRSVPGQPAPPMFRLGAPEAVPHAGNVRNGSGEPIGQVTLEIADVAALRASDYLMEPDPAAAGQWRVTRLVAGQPSTDPADRISFGAGPVEFQGMRIDLGAPPPQPGDRFTLKAVGRAASGMAATLDDPRDIAAAAPLVGVTAPANTGTAAVAELRFVSATLPTPGATVEITFTGNDGQYSWAMLDAGGNPLGPGGTGTWQPGQPIPNPPQPDMNGFSLQLSGVPRAGDVVRVMPTPPEALAANNGNALLLAQLRDATLSEGRTFTDSFALTLSEIGVRVQGARTAGEISQAVALQAERERTGVSGVNLDEEAARLIQYQQSYQAAAKVLQVAQTLLDAVLQASGR
jgi:flagellar hook-associated protein 1 FlgK